jgi:uncharacterized protein YabN with tetrapyrrole methylase and pyrophosphatase domain
MQVGDKVWIFDSKYEEESMEDIYNKILDEEIEKEKRKGNV